ncbi:MAG: acyl-CoA dehydrogenase [Bryobacteraceae bacterium]
MTHHEPTIAAAPLLEWGEEEALFRAAVAEFARKEIAPRVRAMDEAGKLEPELLESLFEMGLMGIEIPEEYGGQGGTFTQALLAIEEIARVDPAVSVVVDVQNTLINCAIQQWGTEEQKRRWLPALAQRTLGAFALSEAGAGSDAFALAARTVREGDTYRLTGRKLWITNAAEAGLFLVFANANPDSGYRGITCFVVERDAAGLQVGRKEEKLGIRASSTCELVLDDVRVPAGNVLGKEGQGYKIAIESLNVGRIGIAAQMTGLAAAALDHAVGYAKQRKQFGRPIAEFQAVRMELARMATDVESARLMVYNAARRREAGLDFVKEAAMAKYWASEIAETVASRAVEIFGGAGFTRDYPVEKLYRDAKIGRIYEGTTNMQLLTIARHLLG